MAPRTPKTVIAPITVPVSPPAPMSSPSQPQITTQSVSIMIDGIIHQANLYFAPVGQGLGWGITLAPKYPETCLTVFVGEFNASLISVDPERQCQLSNFNPQQGSLDLLVPLALEIIQRYGGPAVLYNTDLTDAAMTRQSAGSGEFLSLSLLKIMSGRNSTTYSKYGFYTNQADQARLDREAEFVKTNTGRVLKAELQEHLAKLGLDLNLRLSQLTQLLYQREQYQLITLMHRSLFGDLGTQPELKVEVWYQYKRQHGITLF